MSSTLETAAFIYKSDYSDHDIEDLTQRDHVWYAMEEKEEGFVGSDFKYTVRYGNPQGVSGDFATARANAKASKGVQFTAVRSRKFGVVKIDGESALAAKGDRGAFYDLITMETDSILEEVGDSLAFDFYRDTSGKRGKISAINGNVITLDDPDDARNFKEEMVIVADNAEDGLSPRAGTTEITMVDEDDGKIEVEDISDITGIQVGDYLFREGDGGTCMQGLEVCTPLTKPAKGTDSFRGKDRGVNPRRLAGSRIDNTELVVEKALGLLAVNISKVGKTRRVDRAFCNPTHFFNAATRMGSKVQYDDGGGTAKYGFQYIEIHTSAGTMKLYADPDCPMSRARCSKKGSQYIRHLGGLPHIIDLDGKMMLRQTDENGIECRIEAYPQLIQDDTASQGVAHLAST